MICTKSMSKGEKQPREIILTLGDPCGVGPEIVLAALKQREKRPDIRYRLISHPAIKEWFSFFLVREDILWDCVAEDVNFSLSWGKETLEGGKIAYTSLLRARELIHQGVSSLLVTAPLSKRTVHHWDRNFVDHTSFLAQSCGITDYRMAFWGEKFGVILETIHVPLRQVPSLLSVSHLIKTGEMAYTFAQRLFGKHSLLAICGLNPHAGEGGLLGKEEHSLLLPAVKELRQRGIPIDGPLPADTVFYHALHGKYQVVIALYHDQGLAPFKMLFFEEGVNVTLGLPFVRTSPDHGTGFDIAGKGVASSKSLSNAIEVALRLAE
ncbi:MAG: 4-hydroxythreonine-4-phosphate dehydrogenase PdxA [Brevinematales bacterium]|nr:4-hydroxythreonine-4-phosphate dehydrogenase PdxA [Brevinematales bacterium]